MGAPLTGVRVLEVANMIAGPSAGALLADLGAEVVKVEPPTGDILRGAHRPLEGPAAEAAGAAPDPWWQLDNRGKRSIAVDLAHADGVDVVHRLVVPADVFLTNLTDERRRRYGLTAGDVHARNPAAVYALVTGYGSVGPWAGRPAYDMTAFFARGGPSSVVGDPGGPSPAFRPGQGDHTTALALLAAVLAALRERDRTGAGQVVDVSLYGVAAWTIASDLSVTLLDGAQPPRPRRERWPSPLTCRFRCADSRWIALCMPGPRDFWPAFCAAVERPDWMEDPRFATPATRAEHAEILIAACDEVLASADRATWARRFDDAGLVWAPVHELPEVVADPQAEALGLWAGVEDPATGAAFRTVAAPFAVPTADVAVRGPAPRLGEHTRVVLEEAGLDPAAVDDLLRRGVVR
jgi:crotonobetainyl-CoA:carnitine CoA-transferase CaiB-like acyl-CoA transferase